MKVASGVSAFLGVEGGQIASDVLADSLDLGEFGGTARGGLGVAEVAQLFSEFLDGGTDLGGCAFTDLVIHSLFDHYQELNSIILIY